MLKLVNTAVQCVLIFHYGDQGQNTEEKTTGLLREFSFQLGILIDCFLLHINSSNENTMLHVICQCKKMLGAWFILPANAYCDANFIASLREKEICADTRKNK